VSSCLNIIHFRKPVISPYKRQEQIRNLLTHSSCNTIDIQLLSKQKTTCRWTQWGSTNGQNFLLISRAILVSHKSRIDKPNQSILLESNGLFKLQKLQEPLKPARKVVWKHAEVPNSMGTDWFNRSTAILLIHHSFSILYQGSWYHFVCTREGCRLRRCWIRKNQGGSDTRPLQLNLGPTDLLFSAQSIYIYLGVLGQKK